MGPPTPCQSCAANRAVILRPKNHQKLCKACFLQTFEDEIHDTITRHGLFTRGERVAIGASGGKDSTVLASVLKTLNERHGYGVDLVLLSVDEGIAGYRDDSLETVKRNAVQYDLPLEIVGYKELYGWSMDEVVRQVGKKGNCTYCGVFRRQALDRGAAKLGVGHVVTGHNADDIAETVLMNLLRGDVPRLGRATSIVTSSASSAIKRSKPLKYAYEKEIVLYAHHKKLDYFSTECIYSPEAFRGSARALIKDLERIRPSSILDVVKSGEDMARLVPPEVTGNAGAAKSNFHQDIPDEFDQDGCGSGNGRAGGGEMGAMERSLREQEIAESEELEVEIRQSAYSVREQRRDRDSVSVKTKGIDGKLQSNGPDRLSKTPKRLPQQQMGQCERCGYISSQAICKACSLLEGLNRNRPKREIEARIEMGPEERSSSNSELERGMEQLGLTSAEPR